MENKPEDVKVGAIVIDSAYSTFLEVLKVFHPSFKEIFPNFETDFLPQIERSLKSKLGFDITYLNPLKAIKNSMAPAFFLYANDDKFLKSEHTCKLYGVYPGTTKVLKFCKGDHFDQREDDLIDEIIKTNNRGVSIGRNGSAVASWSFGQSFFFSSTVVTTIGYGHQTPLSPEGKFSKYAHT